MKYIVHIQNKMLMAKNQNHAETILLHSNSENRSFEEAEKISFGCAGGMITANLNGEKLGFAVPIVSVSHRIEKAPACNVINLTESEKEVYRGAGWQIAAFKNEELSQIHSLDDYEYIPQEVKKKETVQRATKHNLDKLKQLESAGFDCWLVMASCYQLCEPARISSSDALSAAKIARRIGEELTNA